MNCIIVEDEHNAADHLEYMLKRINPEIEVLAKLDSIKESVKWLSQNQTDLIFLDVQLGDGISFNIFDQIEILTPIIFTTSYHEYAIEAFKLNSIAYLLKPIDEKELAGALDKYDRFNSPSSMQALARAINKYQKKFLVESGNTIHSFTDEDIAFFMVQNRHVFIILHDGLQLVFNATMDAVEQRLSPDDFFRINRQFIINRSAISRMTTETRGRVKIETNPLSKEEMVVSVDRASAFKEWLS